VQDRVSKDGGAIVLPGSKDPIAGGLQQPAKAHALMRDIIDRRSSDGAVSARSRPFHGRFYGSNTPITGTWSDGFFSSRALR
jgi:hypothetical protein